MPRITTETKWITAIEALILLQWWEPNSPTEPNTRRLIPLVTEKGVTRKKFGNRYKYVREDIEAVYLSQFK